METYSRIFQSEAKEHEVWVLGIPLFREYTVKFNRRSEVMEFAKHETDECLAAPRRGPYSLVATGSGAMLKRLRALPPLGELVYPGSTEVTGFRGAGAGQTVKELNSVKVGEKFVL